MQDDQWRDLLEQVKEKFEVETEAEEVISKDDVGNEMISQVERAIFETPQGEFKLERTTRPVILDKKVHYSHTAGTKGLVEYILSPTEKTQKLTVFKKDDRGNWEELSLASGGFKF